MAKGFEVKIGETVYCQELVSKSNISGRFTYSRDDGLLTELFSFGEYIHIKPEVPLYLLTEQLETISLFDSFGGPGQKHTGEPLNTLHYHVIHSNLALAGPDKWSLSDQVRRIGFSVPEALGVLRNQNKIDRLKMSQHEKDDDGWLLLNLKANGKVIRLSYQAQYSWDGDEPKQVTPRFEIEFDEPIPVWEYSRQIQEILSFLSFALGIRVSPVDISISRISLDEFLRRVESQEHVKDHRILSLWSSDNIEAGDINFYGAPVNSYDDKEIMALGQCLARWIDRSESWYDSYILMISCFFLRHEISGERLMTACRWLEAIPTAKPEVAVSDSDLEAIVDAAFRAADLLEAKIEKQRIKGALRPTRFENRMQHMERLLDLAWLGRRLPRSKEEFLRHLKSAQFLRGRAAHGLLELDDERDFRECARAIAAVEALCFMLTASELPLCENGRDRLPRHRVIENYAHVL